MPEYHLNIQVLNEIINLLGGEGIYEHDEVAAYSEWCRLLGGPTGHTNIPGALNDIIRTITEQPGAPDNLAALNVISAFAGGSAGHRTLLSALIDILENGGGAAEEGGAPPEGALLHMDFTTQQYWLGETSKVIGDLLEGPNFDPTQVDASGMRVADPDLPPPNIPGLKAAALNVIVPGTTVVIEFQQIGGNPPYIGLHDNADPGLAVQGYAADSMGTLGVDARAKAADFVSFSIVSATTNFPAAGETTRVGITMGLDVGGGNYRYYISCNGGAVGDSGDVAYAFPAWLCGGLGCYDPTSAYGQGCINGYLRKFTVYSGATSAALPALTALA